MIRVRYAPSPTGLQHVGSVRTALFDYFLARATGGRFILRIEDTDQSRYDHRSLDDIYESFAWLGIRWDEGPDVGGPYGPYVQSERKALYGEYGQKLLASGHAYLAYDTAEELEAAREESEGRGYDRKFRDMTDEQVRPFRDRGIAPVVRFRVPLEGRTTVHDEILGDMEWENREIIPDPVLLKSDGMPTYHLANVIDDHLMEISHVLRAQEWLASAPLHVLLYDAFGWDPPAFCHLPMVVGEDGRKLGKRHGATGVKEFREKGYLPEALVNYIVRLGWSYDDKQEIFSRGELESLFSLSKINKAPAVFDYKKLDWMNGHYIRELSSAELRDRLVPFLAAAGLVGDPASAGELALLEKAAPLVQERLKLLSEAPQMLRYLFADDLDYDAAELLPRKTDAAAATRLLREAHEALETAPEDDAAAEEILRSLAQRLDTKLGNLLLPLRVAVTGSRVSPPLFGSLRLLGHERVAARVTRAIEKLDALAALG